MLGWGGGYGRRSDELVFLKKDGSNMADLKDLYVEDDMGFGGREMDYYPAMDTMRT